MGRLSSKLKHWASYPPDEIDFTLYRASSSERPARELRYIGWRGSLGHAILRLCLAAMLRPWTLNVERRATIRGVVLCWIRSRSGGIGSGFAGSSACWPTTGPKTRLGTQAWLLSTIWPSCGSPSQPVTRNRMTPRRYSPTHFRYTYPRSFHSICEPNSISIDTTCSLHGVTFTPLCGRSPALLRRVRKRISRGSWRNCNVPS